MLIGVVSAIVLGGLVSLITTMYISVGRSNAYEQALGIAEAGIHYYRWHLSHSPNDYYDGTGESGLYTHDYRDPQGYLLGKYTLEIVPPDPGSSIIIIRSTGSTVSYPNLKRTVEVKFGIPSLAEYAFLHNSNVWFGSGLTVHGRVMSNGGIRQDGINDSVLQSAKSSYVCGQETGCSPNQEKPGIWGYGGPSSLWEYPVPSVDFNAISTDFNKMKNDAQLYGVYRGPSSRQGYHVVFNSNGTASVYEVSSTSYYRGYDVDEGCRNLYQRITGETLLGTYNLNQKHIFFFEDTVWVEGVVNGKATVVAARFPIDTNNEDIWIKNNLTYLSKNGENQLGVIAQRNIYFSKNVADPFEINGALLAQKGKIIRHNYNYSACATYSDAVKNRLIIYGSIISNQKSYWNWGTQPLSGFRERDVTYDNHLYLIPPPYFPVSGDYYEYISWAEVKNP